MKKVKIIALVSAVVTALLLFVFLNSLNKPTEVPKITVLTAAAPIPADTPITADMLTAAELPSEAVLPGAMTDPSQVVGKVAKAEIYPGEQLLGEKLVEPGESSENTLAYAIEPGMRAITIAVSETSGVAFMITPGNHIDILGAIMYDDTSADAGGGDPAAGNAASGESGAKSYTTLLLENVHVLAVDRVLSKSGKVNTDAPVYTTLTLQVTPEEAMKLSMAQFEGELRMLLRSPLDEDLTKLPSLTLDDIMRKEAAEKSR